MKRILTIFILITVTIGALFLAAQATISAKSSLTARETMTTANRLYEAGRFKPAGQAYQQLVDQGLADPTLYYNLGNAYFKQGDLGLALLNYRRAERLAPRDPDIAANLALVQAQIGDTAETAAAKAGPVSRLGRWTQEWLTLNEIALAALMTWIAFVFFVIAFNGNDGGQDGQQGRALREILQYALITAALLLGIGLAGLSSRLYVEQTQPAAVVVAEEVNVAAGPGSPEAAVFTLTGGTEVTLLEKRATWRHVAWPAADLQGWVPAETVEAVTETMN